MDDHTKTVELNYPSVTATAQSGTVIIVLGDGANFALVRVPLKFLEDFYGDFVQALSQAQLDAS